MRAARTLPVAFLAAACASAPAAATRSETGGLDGSALAAWERRQPAGEGGEDAGGAFGAGHGYGYGAGDGVGNGDGIGNGQGDPAGQGRPGRSRCRIDVAFDAAPLGEALRFLADAAGLDVVLTDVPPARVTLRLRNVDPRDALVALANAHGLGVAEVGPTLVLRPVRGGPGP